MEALSALEADRKYRLRFQDELNIRIKDAQRNLNSQYAQSLYSYLQQARLDNELLLKEIEARLVQSLNQLATKAEMIPLTADMLQEGLQSSLTNEPTDKLILSCILHHARSYPDEVKVFLSGNTNDFGKQEVREALRDIGIDNYFRNTQAFIDWL